MNWVSWLFLFVSFWGAWFSLNALTPQRRGVYLASWSFVSGWLTGDLALHHIVWQACATAIFGALGAFEALPGQLGLAVTGVSWLALAWTQVRSSRARSICQNALREDLDGDASESKLADRALAPPRKGRPSAFGQLALAIPRLPGNVQRTRDIRYARAGGIDLHLDVYRSRDPVDGCPVLFQIHGGAWVALNKNYQALPLIHRLSSNGWVCVSVNYRLSPHATFPDHIIDVKRALAWVKQNISEYGGDPDFIVATGGSAGGHLCALTGLTPNDPEYQPGFEHVDTTVQGCIPFYGVYDVSGATEEHDLQSQLLERHIMKGSRQEMPEAYESASPIRRVGAHAPPFFVIHGDCDTVVPVPQARAFVRELRRGSLAPVAYAELPGAQHGFEVFHNLRSAAVVDAAERFANTLHLSFRSMGRDHDRAAVASVGRPQLRAV